MGFRKPSKDEYAQAESELLSEIIQEATDELTSRQQGSTEVPTSSPWPKGTDSIERMPSMDGYTEAPAGAESVGRVQAPSAEPYLDC